MTDIIRAKQEESALWITINNPQRANSLTRAALTKIAELVDAFEDDQQLRALVLTGSGDKVFCAGADINEWASLSPNDYANQWIRFGHAVFDKLAYTKKPVLAAINGHALGGGLELAAACDIRIAVRAKRFGLPEPSLGIIPGWSGTQRLTRELPIALLRAMLFAGAQPRADAMYACGFINEVVDADQLSVRVHQIVQDIAKLAPLAVETAKKALNLALGEKKDVLAEMLAGGFVAATRDARHGVDSFKTKQEPKWRGE